METFFIIAEPIVNLIEWNLWYDVLFNLIT